MNIFDLMAAPFAECLVLVAIHTYLGIHVLKRRVIFVDLALAQIAALGTTVGFIFGIMPETTGALLFSIAFTFVGAAVFALTRFRNERIPQEAIIGLSYAIACAVAVLVVEKTKGAEHLKDILVGNLLWVTWPDVVSAALVYASVGVVHFLFRKKFNLISNDPEDAFRTGVSVRGWDFLFYLTFGIVIAFSTRVAGVLMVFVFLVAPAILAFLITERFWLQLLIGWTTGTAVTTIGLYLSWVADLPSGPTVIAFYGVALIAGALSVTFIQAENKLQTLSAIATAAVVATLLGFAICSAGHWIASSSLAISDDALRVEQERAQQQRLTATRQSAERSLRRDALEKRCGTCVQLGLIERYLSYKDLEQRIAIIKDELTDHRKEGLELLYIALCDDSLPLLYRDETLDLLVKELEENPDYDTQQTVSQNAPALRRICDRMKKEK